MHVVVFVYLFFFSFRPKTFINAFSNDGNFSETNTANAFENIKRANDTSIKKHVSIRIYTTDGNTIKGLLAGRSGGYLLIYP